jgi:SAM-dependent methyltransferase
MTDESLEVLLQRLEDERKEADRLYGAALTALDQSLQRPPDLPASPTPYDATQVHPINLSWKILAGGPPPVERSLKGRLRAFIWALVGPAIERQQAFNGTLVDHLNRNVAAHTDAPATAAALIGAFKEHVDGLLRLQHLLVAYLQTITLYVDTKDRAVAGQAQVLNAAVSALTGDWLKRWESLNAREQRFNARVAETDDLRAAVALAQQTSLTLKREVERFLASEGHSAAAIGASGTVGRIAAPDLDAFKYVGFEDAFRGSQAQIRARLSTYVPMFADHPDVLDIGCGRGEFLDLLRARGIRARGLDVNHEMVEVARGRGLEVVEDDAAAYVASLPDESLGGVFAAQVVEHLEPGYLMRLIETVFHKLRPGGVIVLETINPACWVAFFESYIRDLTHVRPIHPDTLQYLLRASGFQHVDVQYLSPIPESARLQTAPRPPTGDPSGVSGLIETFNENVAKLNGRLFTYQDYAAIGRKQPAAG